MSDGNCISDRMDEVIMSREQILVAAVRNLLCAPTSADNAAPYCNREWREAMGGLKLAYSLYGKEAP